MLELVIPSKLVLGDPVDNCTVTGVVKPKNVGSDWMVKVFGGATLATVPVTRVNRRKRKFVLAVANVEPEAAVKDRQEDLAAVGTVSVEAELGGS